MICQKMKKHLYFGLAVFMSLYFSLCSCIGSYASDSTSSGQESAFEYTENYVRKNFNALCRYVVKWNAIISDGIIGTWNNFTDWLDSSGNSDIWEQHPHSPIRTNGDVEVPEEVLNVINQYVIYQIQQNPETYTQCDIPSYNMLNSDYFYTYQSFVAVKDFIRQSGCYCYLSHNNTNNSTRKFYIITIPTSVNYGLYGTVTSGIFTNVNAIYNWQATTQPFNLSLGLKFYTCNPDGTISETAVAQGNIRSLSNISNVPSNTALSQNWVIMSPLPRNETVYVFNTVDAYKRFNSGSPQPYYLTTEGQTTSMSNWQVGSGTINTGTLSSANSTYSSVINNVQSGWTAQEVLNLVNMISQNGGSGSGGSSGDSDNDSKWWERIGNAIGNLIDGLVEVLSTVIEKLSEALLSVIHLLTGYTDEQGVVHEGLFGKLLNLVNSGFNNFLASIFSWLPEEIVTLFTAVLVFGIFFGLLKMLRR